MRAPRTSRSVLRRVAPFVAAMVAIAAFGAGQNWSANQPSTEPAATAPGLVGAPLGLTGLRR